jgi:hypothetical protein
MGRQLGPREEEINVQAERLLAAGPLAASTKGGAGTIGTAEALVARQLIEHRRVPWEQIRAARPKVWKKLRRKERRARLNWKVVDLWVSATPVHHEDASHRIGVAYTMPNARLRTKREARARSNLDALLRCPLTASALHGEGQARRGATVLDYAAKGYPAQALKPPSPY